MQHIPQRLIDRIRTTFGETNAARIIAGWHAKRPSSFRINTLQSSAEEVESALGTLGIPFTRATWLPDAYQVAREHEYALKGSGLFRTGKIYMQGLASQIPPHALDLTDGLTVLDMTAAPGGKTTHIAALMHNTGKIVASEKHQIRFDKMAHNLSLQGVTNVESLKASASQLSQIFPVGAFDRILLDAPCSAEGRIDADEERSYGYWRPECIARNVELQKQLLDVALPLLAPGGLLVYSTCTLSPEENESMVAYACTHDSTLQIEPLPLMVPEALPALTTYQSETYGADMANAVRVLPSATMEGFFVARMRKVS